MSINPISELQEFAQSHKWPLPIYTECERDGNLFTYKVNVQEIEASGKGVTKKAAKVECAQKALQKITEDHSVTKKLPPKQNYVEWLHNYASITCNICAKYTKFGMDETGVYNIKCNFLNLEVDGVGFNKKIAKQDAAEKMFQKLKEMEPAWVEKVAQIYDLPSDTGNLMDIIEQKQESSNISIVPPGTTLQQDSQDEDNLRRVEAVPQIDELEELLAKMNVSGYPYEFHKLTSSDCPSNPSIVMLQIKTDPVPSFVIDRGQTDTAAKINVLKKAFSTLVI